MNSFVYKHQIDSHGEFISVFFLNKTFEISWSFRFRKLNLRETKELTQHLTAIINSGMVAKDSNDYVL